MFRNTGFSLSTVCVWLIFGYFTNSYSQDLNPGSTSSVEAETTGTDPSGATRKPLIQARISSSLIYSDNILLAPPGEEDEDLVFEIRPGFTIQRESNRLTARLDYDMRNFHYSDEGRTDTHHQLNGTASLELLEERFFIDTAAFFREELADGADNLGADILSNPDDFDEVYGFRISPFFREELGQFADLEARYSYDNVQRESDVSDSETHTVEIDLSDGRQFSILDWSVSYRTQITDRKSTDREATFASSDDGQSKEETFLAQVEYPIDTAWALAGRVGYENSDVTFQTNEEDGSFWSLGFLWTPSRFFDASAFYGPRDNEVDFRFSPTTRTSLKLNRLDREVGLNIGTVWSGSLNHRTRYSSWAASYSEGTISGAVLDFEEAFVPFGGIEDVPPIITNLVNERLTTNDIFTSTSSDFDRQRLEAQVSYNRARTFASLGGFHERRNFRTDNIPTETGFGVLAAVARVLNPRSVALVSIDWQNSEIKDNNDDNDLLILRAALAHTFTRDVSAFFFYRYADREANDSTRDFQENRIGASMRLNF